MRDVEEFPSACSLLVKAEVGRAGTTSLCLIPGSRQGAQLKLPEPQDSALTRDFRSRVGSLADPRE